MNTAVLLSGAIVILGWLAVHRLAAARDRENKRRDVRTQYLIEAWRRLERSCHRDVGSDSKDLESALADVQLFGEPRQVQLARRFANDFANPPHNATLNELLEELRTDLRRELRLQPVDARLVHLRVIPPATEPPPPPQPQ